MVRIIRSLELWMAIPVCAFPERNHFSGNGGVVGSNEAAEELLSSMVAIEHLGYKVRLILDDGKERSSVSGNPCSRDANVLRKLVGEQSVDLVVIANEPSLKSETRRLLFDLLEHNIQYIGMVEFYELILRRVPLGTISESWFLENLTLRSVRPYQKIKRIIDFFGALGLICITLPLYPFIAAMIKVESRGPVFFVQERLGLLSKTFKLVKFRSMKVEGNDHAPTLKGDERITPFGRLLRSTRIDEIPQVLNILRGEMSFIGPRPERPSLAVELERVIPWYRQRLLVKPGVTGWDQVSGNTTPRPSSIHTRNCSTICTISRIKE